MITKLDLTRLRELRESVGLPQEEFWPLFGVTRFRGSRYESGLRPRPCLVLLLHFWHSGKLTDEDLIRASNALSRRKTVRNAQLGITRSFDGKSEPDRSGTLLTTAQLTPARLRELRKRQQASQRDFWGRFGVSQNCGSQYEISRSIAKPVAILVSLWHSGKLTDKDLAATSNTRAVRRRKTVSGNDQAAPTVFP